MPGYLFIHGLSSDRCLTHSFDTFLRNLEPAPSNGRVWGFIEDDCAHVSRCIFHNILSLCFGAEQYVSYHEYFKGWLRSIRSSTSESKTAEECPTCGRVREILRDLKCQLISLTRYEKLWIDNSPYQVRELWDKFILWGCIAVGFCIGSILCYFAYTNVPRHEVWKRCRITSVPELIE